MASYDKNLHKYDKIGQDETEPSSVKPEQMVNRYAPGTLEPNGPQDDFDRNQTHKTVRDNRDGIADDIEDEEYFSNLV